MNEESSTKRNDTCSVNRRSTKDKKDTDALSLSLLVKQRHVNFFRYRSVRRVRVRVRLPYC